MVGEGRAASGAPGTVKSCVVKIGGGTYASEELVFKVEDDGEGGRIRRDDYDYGG